MGAVQACRSYIYLMVLHCKSFHHQFLFYLTRILYLNTYSFTLILLKPQHTAKKQKQNNKFAFIIQLIPALIFAELLDKTTNGSLSVAETLLSAGIIGILYSILSGQPLVLIGITGYVRFVVIVFYVLLYCSSSSVAVRISSSSQKPEANSRYTNFFFLSFFHASVPSRTKKLINNNIQYIDLLLFYQVHPIDQLHNLILIIGHSFGGYAFGHQYYI